MDNNSQDMDKSSSSARFFRCAAHEELAGENKGNKTPKTAGCRASPTDAPAPAQKPQYTKERTAISRGRAAARTDEEAEAKIRSHKGIHRLYYRNHKSDKAHSLMVPKKTTRCTYPEGNDYSEYDNMHVHAIKCPRCSCLVPSTISRSSSFTFTIDIHAIWTMRKTGLKPATIVMSAIRYIPVCYHKQSCLGGHIPTCTFIGYSHLYGKNSSKDEDTPSQETEGISSQEAAKPPWGIPIQGPHGTMMTRLKLVESR